MTRKQAEYLASFNCDYSARCIKGQWLVWSAAADHMVEFDRLLPVDHYGEVLRNRRTGFLTKLPLMIVLSLVAGGIASAQGVSNCLANAARDYKAQWLNHCPGGVQYNFPACQLPPLIAAEVKADWATSRGLCFENHNAEAIDRADEIQRGPGLTDDPPQAAPATADNEPRRKFWISPQ